jgi:hypothetical protein
MTVLRSSCQLSGLLLAVNIIDDFCQQWKSLQCQLFLSIVTNLSCLREIERDCHGCRGISPQEQRTLEMELEYSIHGWTLDVLLIILRSLGKNFMESSQLSNIYSVKLIRLIKLRGNN